MALSRADPLCAACLVASNSRPAWFQVCFPAIRRDWTWLTQPLRSRIKLNKKGRNKKERNAFGLFRQKAPAMQVYCCCRSTNTLIFYWKLLSSSATLIWFYPPPLHTHTHLMIKLHRCTSTALQFELLFSFEISLCPRLIFKWKAIHCAMLLQTLGREAGAMQ